MEKPPKPNAQAQRTEKQPGELTTSHKDRFIEFTAQKAQDFSKEKELTPPFANTEAMKGTKTSSLESFADGPKTQTTDQINLDLFDETQANEVSNIYSDPETGALVSNAEKKSLDAIRELQKTELEGGLGEQERARNLEEQSSLRSFVDKGINNRKDEKTKQLAQQVNETHEKLLEQEEFLQEQRQETQKRFNQETIQTISPAIGKDEDGNKLSIHEKNNLYKEGLAVLQEIGVEPSESKMDLAASLDKASGSKERLEKRHEEYVKKSKGEQVKATPGYLFGGGVDVFRHMRDRAKVSEDYLVERINSTTGPFYSYPLSKKITSGAIKGVGSVLRNSIPFLGLGLFFGFSWLADIGLNKLRKISEKNGAGWLWKRKPAAKENKK